MAASKKIKNGHNTIIKAALCNKAFIKSLKIAFIYLILGFLWIVFTDKFAGQLFGSASFYTLSLVKGLLYVLLTAAVIFALIYSDLIKVFKLGADLQAANESLKQTNSKLLMKERALLAAQGLAHIGSFEYNLTDNTVVCTSEALKIFGITQEALSDGQSDILKHALHEDREIIGKAIINFMHEQKPGQFQCRFYSTDGGIKHTIICFEPAEAASDKQLLLSGTIQDITEPVLAMEALRESERSKAVLLSHLPGVAYRCMFDRERTMKFLSEGFYSLTGYEAKDFIDNTKHSYAELISPEYRDAIWSTSASCLSRSNSYKYEYEIVTDPGEKKWVLDMGQAVYDESHNIQALEGILIDHTETKNHIEQIKYINDHDYLTGLYNRRYFETVIEEQLNESWLPVSFIVADINGIKLINDAFGYHEGDELIKLTAEKIKACCRGDDIACRLGGDDFAVILPRTGKEQTTEIVMCIRRACEEYNAKLSDATFSITLSLGCGAYESMTGDVSQALKDAESSMAKQKLLTKRSHHSEILSSIMATMYARSCETEEHARRIARISLIIGDRMGLSQSSLDELQLFSMLHDIGKIGVADRILNKPCALTDEEWDSMRRHTEIGYKIAMSSHDFSTIADYILCHHERWDGKGYPNGLKGEEIPLLSRILAVADAYDAMTEDRVYRKAISHEEAINEIIKNSGKQFDPAVVSVFISGRHV